MLYVVIYSICVIKFVSCSVPVIYASQLCFNKGIFKTFLYKSLDKCSEECLLTRRCVGLSFNRQMSACFLFDSNFNEPASQTDNTACINLNASVIAVIMLTMGACSKRPCPGSSLCFSSRINFDDYECKVTECSETESENALIANGMRGIGQINTFKCKPGYTMFGNATVTCTHNGTWSKADFQCYQNCPMPKVANADIVMYNPRLAFNTTGTYECLTGYYNVTPAITTCNANGQWSSANCFKYCLEPLNIDNAIYIDKTPPYTLNSTIEYSCDIGYYLNDSSQSSITCLQDGSWTAPHSSCFKYCLEPVDIDNAIYMDKRPPYTINTTINYSCNVEYYLNDSSQTSITCLQDGSWAALYSACFKHCPEPLEISNAAFLGKVTPYTIHTTLEYSCNAEYYLNDPAEPTISCLQDGTWTVPHSTCSKYCSGLPYINNAERVDSPSAPYTTSSVAKYKCNWGNHFDGDYDAVKSFHCNSNGHWDGYFHCCPFAFEWDGSRSQCCSIGISFTCH